MTIKSSAAIRAVSAVASIGMLAAVSHAQVKYDFFLVDSFNANPLAGETFLYDINDLGTACGVATMDNVIGYVGIVWDEVSGKTVVPVPNPLGINDSGLIVGTSTVYSMETGEVFHPTPLPGIQFGPAFAGVNDAGVAVGVAPTSNSNPNLLTPYRWDEVSGGSAMSVPVSWGGLRRINNAGVAVGYALPGPTGEGFFVDLETDAYTWLGSVFPSNLGFGPTRGFDINDSGAVVGTRYGNYPVYFYGYVYSPTTGLQILPFLGPPYQQAVLPRGINNAGAIVGDIFIMGSSRGFVYTPADGLRDLDDGTLVAGTPPGYDFYSTQKISNSGWIVGYGQTAAGKTTGFVLKPRAGTGDLNGDGRVDGADLGALLGAWGSCVECPADLNGDGAVNGADLGLMLGAWTG